MTAILEWQIQAVLAVTPISRTWRVASGDQRAVLRRDRPGARHLGLNREAEPAVLRAAAAAGFGPACLAADPAHGLLLTEWLPGRAWSAADLQESGNLHRAAVLLRRLHATPLAGPVVDLGAAIERYAQLAAPVAADVAAAARAELAICRAVDSDPLCFCHNDPTPGNFLAAPDGGLHLVDWEYAGLGHAHFDLAGLAVGANLTSRQEEQLLSAYWGRPPSRAEGAAFGAWEVLYRRLADLWGAALAQINQSFTADC